MKEQLGDIAACAITITGGLAGIGMFFVSIAGFSAFIICILARACG